MSRSSVELPAGALVFGRMESRPAREELVRFSRSPDTESSPGDSNRHFAGPHEMARLPSSGVLSGTYEGTTKSFALPGPSSRQERQRHRSPSQPFGTNCG